MIIVNPTTPTAALIFMPRVYPSVDVYVTITQDGTNNPVEVLVSSAYIEAGGEGNVKVSLWTANQGVYPVDYTFKEGYRYNFSVRLYGDPDGNLIYRGLIYATAQDELTSYRHSINDGLLAVDVNGDDDAYIILED